MLCASALSITSSNRLTSGRWKAASWHAWAAATISSKAGGEGSFQGPQRRHSVTTKPRRHKERPHQQLYLRPFFVPSCLCGYRLHPDLILPKAREWIDIPAGDDRYNRPVAVDLVFGR